MKDQERLEMFCELLPTKVELRHIAKDGYKAKWDLTAYNLDSSLDNKGSKPLLTPLTEEVIREIVEGTLYYISNGFLWVNGYALGKIEHPNFYPHWIRKECLKKHVDLWGAIESGDAIEKT